MNQIESNRNLGFSDSVFSGNRIESNGTDFRSTLILRLLRVMGGEAVAGTFESENFGTSDQEL